MTKTSAVLFILFFSLLFKLEEPVSKQTPTYTHTETSRLAVQFFSLFTVGLLLIPPHLHPSVPPEPTVDPGGTADLWRPLHVYVPVDPVQPGGLPYGADGRLPRGNPLDFHAGPHAEGRIGSVLGFQ